MQHEWSILDRLDGTTERQLASVPSIHHRALTEHFRTVAETMRTAPAQCQRWSDAVGADLDDPSVLAALMLKAALEVYPKSVLLVSSKNRAHLRENVRAAGDELLREPALRLATLVAREGLPLRSRAEAAC